jgi:hypothetical protein
MASQLNQLPASLEPLAMFGSKDVPCFVKPVWYKFFQSLSAVLADLVGSVLGFTISPTVIAAGVTQGTATQLNNEWSVITVTPVGAGVLLANFGAGVPQTVFNRGANNLNVYPLVGGKIDVSAVNLPYVLAPAKMQTFSQVSGTQFYSTQLG